MTVLEPDALAGDNSRIDDAWAYALEAYINTVSKVPDVVVCPQITSPLRKPSDVTNAVVRFIEGNYDSMMSVVHAKDLCLWQPVEDGVLNPVVPECLMLNRKRQRFPTRVIENGSLYLFKPWVLKQNATFLNVSGTAQRFAGKLGTYEMKSWQLPEIDEPDDCALCEVLLMAYLKGDLL
jgi:N-acylneuraminate cytidylyltransferase